MSKLKLDAEHYSQNSQVQKLLADDLLNKYIFSGDEVALDIGCGNGVITHEIAKKLSKGSILGVDPSNEMINLATNTYEKDENLCFKTGYAEKFLINDKYNLITAFSCLHWVHDIPNLFRDIYMSLRNKGSFIGVTFPKESLYWDIILDVSNSKKWKNECGDIASKYWLKSNEYLDIINQAGFCVKYFKISEESVVYNRKEDLENYIKGWLPCLISFNNKVINDFLEDLSNNAWSKYHIGNHCKTPYTKLEFILTKDK